MVAFVSGSLVVFKSRTGSNSQLDDPEPIATLRFSSSSSSSVELCLKFEEILGKNLHDTYQIIMNNHNEKKFDYNIYRN